MSALRVLVVDDDFRVAGLHRDIVDAHPGLQALEPARTLHDALAAVRADPPDLMLVDAYLPDGDGIAFVRAHEIDAFVLSAATDAATVRRALRAGAVGYLMKPFEGAALTERLDRYVRYRNLIGGDATLRQDDLDRALAILAGSAAGSVSRSATEQLILEALAVGEASSSEVAERAGLSRATAQRHLSTLASRGHVVVRLRYGTTGRPEHLYRVA
ncbi:MAG: two-component system response regulator [Microbacterium sp. SCN 70-200]|uniref:response regulator n=1 Tax=unclassified Microbacterium TaxID=2609290 RepID=UPI00086EDE77|nr:MULTISPECIES: response regulator [unclassified Microbacterium]MBN9213449.1 response regulator [Microbacterium sp.]ODT40449.1 MAG: two-component system response regulator [Microbacterium sp. SCN 70-200]OJV85082.1 MAG: two-component system response regulator [Microbacterium sp. 70-16]